MGELKDDKATVVATEETVVKTLRRVDKEVGAGASGCVSEAEMRVRAKPDGGCDKGSRPQTRMVPQKKAKITALSFMMVR